MRRKGFCVCTPVDAFPPGGSYDIDHDLSRPDVRQRHRNVAASGKVGWAHFGLPCRTWGSFARLNGGSRTRQHPKGITPSDKEEYDNDLVDLVFEGGEGALTP